MEHKNLEDFQIIQFLVQFPEKPFAEVSEMVLKFLLMTRLKDTVAHGSQNCVPGRSGLSSWEYQFLKSSNIELG